MSKWDNSLKELQAHFKLIESFTINDLFAADPSREENFSIKLNNIKVDFSKNNFDYVTLKILFQLAKEQKLYEAIKKIYSGDYLDLNYKPVQHVKKRIDWFKELHTRSKEREFIEKLHNGELRGITNNKIKNIIFIGIGGSYLGLILVSDALKNFWQKNSLESFFISAMDDDFFESKNIDPTQSIFIVSSKSFTTIETITNFKRAFSTFNDSYDKESVFNKHFFAITACKEKALELGFKQNNIFCASQEICGRYSIWSAGYIPIAAKIGLKHFDELIKGACEIDEHFVNTQFEFNLPVILGLIDYLNNNVVKITTRLIAPYNFKLKYLPAYLQQVFMESLGKNNLNNSSSISIVPIYGLIGTEVQHSVFQYLHQHKSIDAIDFIIIYPDKNSNDYDNQKMLEANALAQCHLLAFGHTNSNKELSIVGNKPQNILYMDAITPENLGALLALYEHRIFVQSVMCGLDAFTQYGVEIGKKLAQKIYKDL